MISSTATRISRQEMACSRSGSCAHSCAMISAGQVPVRFGIFGLDRDVTGGEGEVLAQAGGRAAGAGHPEGPQPSQKVADLAADPRTGVGRDPPLGGQERQPTQEVLDVAAAQHVRVFPAVLAGGPPALRQRGQADQVLPHRPGAVLAAPLRQVLGGPPFGRLPQPALADLAEVRYPRSPNAVRSHTSLTRSVSGSRKARPTCRTKQRKTLCCSPRPSTSSCSSETSWRRRSAAAIWRSRAASVIAPSRVRCCSP